MGVKLIRALFSAIIVQMLVVAPADARQLSKQFEKVYQAYNQAYAQSDWQRTADLAGQAVDLAKKELGPDNEKTAILEINLGHALLLSGNADKAEATLKTAEATLVKLKGPDDPDLITVHTDMAGIYAKRKDLDKAMGELDKAISITVKKYGNNDPRVANLAMERGDLDLARKDLDAAGADFNQALTIRRKHFGADAPETGDALLLVGDVEMLQKQYKAAEREYSDALAIYKKSLVADDPRIIAAHTRLANLFIKMHDSRFAEHADKVIALSPNQNGAALPLFVVQPKYPMLKDGKPAQGWVLLNFTVTTAGRVADAKVLESRPKGRFDKLTLDAARQWRFKPYVKDGKRLPQPDTRARVVYAGGKIRVDLGQMSNSGNG